VKVQSSFDVHKAEWIRKYNPDALFQDESYKKHLKHQCNKWVDIFSEVLLATETFSSTS